MAELLRAAQPALAELQDCVPQRDYLRPTPHRYEAGEEPLPARPHDASKASTPYLVACVQVLLARQVNRPKASLALRAAAEHRGLRVAAATVLPDRSFARIVRDFDSQPVGEFPDDLYIPGAVVEVHDATSGDMQVWPQPLTADISFRFVRSASGLKGSIAYNRLLYRPGTIVSLARQLVHLLSSLSPQSETDSQLVSLLDRDELHRIVHGLNENRIQFPVCTLSDLIEAQTRRTPGDSCVVHGDRCMTYAELDATSHRLAGLLRSLGIRPGSFVAIIDHRGTDFVVAMLAIWKAGGAYIPIDAGYPEDRVRYMLQDSESPVALVGAGALARFALPIAESTSLTDVVCLHSDSLPSFSGRSGPRVHQVHDWLSSAPADASPKALATDPAYMIYTSGSTGRPKGAIVRHDGAVNHLFAQAHCLGRDGIRRFLQTAPSSSDISVWQFAAPLAFGGVTVIVDDVTDVENLLTQVRRHGLQVIELVPVVMRYLVDYAASLSADERALPSLRWAMVTGESASVELVNAWLAIFPHIPVVNAYGPTEAADDVAQAILYEPLPANQLTVPIGRPLPNMAVYVLDDHLHPVPTGALGEICVAGVGVGNGYWQMPEQTRERFVANPFADAARSTLYRTGDIGRLRDDGSLECLGRRDHQVQLRGFRIELQEIEALLCTHPSVSNAAAQVFHDGDGDGRLIAYAVLDPANAAEPPNLRGWLADRLPPAMLPSSVVPLERLPLNPAGKIDRNALLPPEPTALDPNRAGTATRSAAESVLATLWQQELGIERVALDDDFFDLGGDSLSALAIVVGARSAGLRLRPADVLQHPTVARLARVVSPLRPRADLGTVPLDRAPASAARGLTDDECKFFLLRETAYETVYALTPQQQGIFLHWLLAKDKTAYVDQYSFTLRGPLSPAAFRQAWEHVATRHPMLRTAFLRSALSEPAQAVLRQAPVDFEFADHAHLDLAASAEALRRSMAATLQRGFSLARPPLSRVLLVRLAPQMHRLVWTHHHIVVDGWSMSVVLSEVLQVHAALGAGRPAQLPAAPSYERYAAWLRQQDLSSSESFWRMQLAGFAGAPPLSVPGPHEPILGFGQTDIGLAAELGDLLVQRARDVGVTLPTLLMAAWACLLSRLGGNDDVVFGMVASGRELDLESIDSIVGLFATTLPLRVDARGVGPVAGWLKALQQRSATVRDHGSVSLSQITRWNGLAPDHTLFDTLFVMSNYLDIDQPAQRPLRVELAEFRTVPAYPMSVIVSPGRTLAMRLVYDYRRFDDPAAAELASEYTALLDCLARGQDPRIAV
jgi:amino acid adenylation domain-containing protein